MIEGDDWLGPVSWTDTDGSEHTMIGDELVSAAESLSDGTLNPDREFIRAVANGRPAWPDMNTAVAAHQVVEAMYESARNGGSSQMIPPAVRR
ncbi:MAG: hypothetical protein ABIR32_21195 [Ilumatobacteraceae bacterium]